MQLDDLMFKPGLLKGQRVLVTGGGTGLGKVMGRRFLELGADLMICGRREAVLAATAQEFEAAFGRPVRIHRVDLRHAEAVDELMEVAFRDRPLDILVNNAAANRRGPLDSFGIEQWRSLMATNLDGPFYVTRVVIPGMKARRRGKIINLCSLASDIGRPNIVPYAVSKGGMRMLTRALAVELAPHNIQVNGIAPGFFKTEMNAALSDDREFSAWVARRTPAGRWGEAQEIAGAAVFLASAAADYVTGHLLAVDGGFGAAY